MHRKCIVFFFVFLKRDFPVYKQLTDFDFPVFVVDNYVSKIMTYVNWIYVKKNRMFKKENTFI